jgi:hypothetical protein
MKTHYCATGALTLLLTTAAPLAIAPMRPIGMRPSAAPGSATLHAFGSRRAKQPENAYGSKLDAMLADLSRHIALARPGHMLADLRSLSPAARFTQPSAGAAPRVLVDAITRGDPQRLKEALVALGLERSAVYSNDVGGWLPVTEIDAAAASPEVHSIRAAMPRTRTGAVTSQGDFAARSDVLRSTYPTLTGAGVRVGVLSDSFDCYAIYAQPGSGVPASGPTGYAPNGFLADAAQDVATGDLRNVDVLEEAPCMEYGQPTQLPFTDEGRAILQVVYDIAPGTSLAFYTADNSEADFANGILALAAAGATIEADDAAYFDEPFFQDGILAQAIDTVEAHGVAYFSAAGNDGQLSYENTAPSFATLSTSPPNAGEYLLNFDNSGVTTTTALPVMVPALVPGEFIGIVVEWDQPYVTGAPNSGGATSSIDVCVTGASGRDTITDLDGNSVTCTGPNAAGVDPVQILVIGNPANANGNTSPENLNIVVGLAGGTTPGRVLVAVEDNGAGSTINAFATNSAALKGHPGAAGAAAVGAAFYFLTSRCGTTPAVLETFSSQGGAPILFDTSGDRLATPVVRQKPDFVGPDGVNDTFLGFTLASAGVTGANGELNTSISECQNDAKYPNFFGTSAATPHAAGIAALMLQANPAVTPTQIYAALRTSALPMGGTTPNFNSGYGFIQADAAMALLPPAPPALSLSANSIVVGGSVTLSWSSINTTSCTASGSWSGTQQASGSQTVTPTAAGTSTYTLECANAAGSATNTASLTVTPAAVAASGGGGGAIGGLALLSLACIGLARRFRPKGA